jgi:N utilization substance protein B
MGNRRTAREYVLKALFAQELGQGDTEHTIDTVLEPLEKQVDDPTYEFAVKLFLRTLDHLQELDTVIAEHAKNWEVERIAVIDKVLLRMALTEFLYVDDIPPKVSIDEALEIAKIYSTPSSSQFINGVLDAALKHLKDEGRITKTGRGLIGMNSDPTADS